jgi:hypothetical protein
VDRSPLGPPRRYDRLQLAVVRGEWKSSRRGRSPVLAEGSLTKDGIPPFLLDKPGTWSLVVFDASGAFRALPGLQARKDSK